ncbi:hypothetical protein HHI36_013668 [Cryptolaemus montrouzieri]|uniref:Uncharacterized protein n=1 Tax=Cryptolaemus montrouzieri TaxID=559131 RepID=A0ABD2NIX5_9CUCU
MHASQVMKSNVEMEFSFGPLMKAYDLIVEKYTTASEWGPQALILLFEVLETLVKLYHELKMPREVRCFGKQTLTLAQQHVISVRSAKILTYLAYADFRSERLYDARVKLDGISEILLLENGRRDHDLHQKENKCLGISTMNDITQGIQEIMLDNPNPSAFNIKSSPSSPVFMGEPYRSPSFLKHKSCTCFQCTSAEYFQVAISRFHLEALWYMHKKQITLSNNFFRGTTEFCKELMSKQPVLSLITLQSSMLKSLKGGIDLKHIYSSEEYNYQCSLDHIKFLQTSGAVEAAKKCNKDLVDALKAKKSFYPNLFAEALLQRLGLIYQRKQMVQTVQISLNNVSNDYKFKTPEKTRPLVIKPKSNSPKIKRILPPKVIKFNLADVDCGTSTPAKSIKEYKTPSKSAKNKILPPSLREIKTPLMKTPVRKIFLDGDCKLKSSVKSSMRSNVLSGEEVSASITSCLEISDDGVSKRLPLIEISEQNFKYTNGSLQNEEIQAIPKIKIKDNLMEVKTKMLTAKLRKKVDIKSIPNNSCETNGQTRESTSKIKNNTSQEPGVSDSISKANGHSSKNSSSRKKVVNSHKNLAETETARRSRRNRT